MTQLKLDEMMTEARNTATLQLDCVSTMEMVRLFNDADHGVADAVQCVLPAVAAAIDAASVRMEKGGRLVYLGAGTSGRLGVVDASECPPTFGVSYDVVRGVMAGGEDAMFRASECSEDDEEAGIRDLQAIGFSAKDTLVGIAASGRTPYVLGGVRYAKAQGALTIALCCNADCALSHATDIAITPVVGPEVLTGSTRLKAGTAQKLVLNMLSTGVMVRLGKVFGNLMVDMKTTNEKLCVRAAHIVALATGVKDTQAKEVLDACDGEVKTAILALLAEVTPAQARRRLAENNGYLRNCME